MGMSTRRKLAIATWSAPREGNIYGKLELDASKVLAYIDRVREETGVKVSLTHVVGRAVALALHKAPGLNGRIVFGAFKPFPSVNVTYLVALEEGADLAKATIEDADEKGVTAIARELRELALRLRKGEDDDFNKSKGLLRALPTWLIRPLLTVTGWLASAVGMSIPALGVKPFPFGSCVVTSVGMLGLDEGFAPPTPFARVPLWVLVGALRDRPVAEDGEVVIRPMVTLTATIDHRFIDGFQGGILAKEMRRVFAEPELLDGSAEA